MKTRAERRLVKRIKHDNEQIIVIAESPDHPLHCFPKDVLKLLLEFKKQMELFEFLYPRLCQLTHDYYIACEIIDRVFQEDGMDEIYWKPFQDEATTLAETFDELIREKIVSSNTRSYLKTIREERNELACGEDEDVKEIIVESPRHNVFNSVAFWKQMYERTQDMRQWVSDSDGEFPPLLVFYYKIKNQIAVPLSFV